MEYQIGRWSSPPSGDGGDDPVAVARRALETAREAQRRGEFDEAQRLLVIAVAAAHRSGDVRLRVEVALEQAMVACDLGLWLESERIYRRTFSLAKKVSATDVQLAAATQLVNVVGNHLGRAVDGEKWAGKAAVLLAHLDVPGEDLAAELAMSRGLLLLRAKRFAEAEGELAKSLMLRIRARGPKHYLVAATQSNLGEALRQQDRLDEAEVQLRGAYELLAADLGAEHPRATFAAADLANVQFNRGYFVNAAEQYRSTLASISKRDDGNTAVLLLNLAMALSCIGQRQGAFDEAEKALMLFRKQDEVGLSAESAKAEAFIAIQQAKLGALATARQRAKRAVKRLQRLLGVRHLSSVENEAVLALIDDLEGNHALAVKRLGRLIEIATAARLPSWLQAHLLNLSGRALLGDLRPKEALDHYRRAFELRNPEEAISRAHSLTGMGLAFLALGELAAAAAAFEESLALLRSRDADPEDLGETLFGLAQALEQIDRGGALRLADEALRIYESLGKVGAARATQVREWLANHPNRSTEEAHHEKAR